MFAKRWSNYESFSFYKLFNQTVLYLTISHSYIHLNKKIIEMESSDDEGEHTFMTKRAKTLLVTCLLCLERLPGEPPTAGRKKDNPAS